MPQQRPKKVQTPLNSDAFNLVPDLAIIADTTGGVVTVANQTEGDSVASALATAGWPVSDARPLFVFNQATGTIQYKDSTGWKNFNSPLGLIYQVSVGTSSGAVADAIINNFASFTFVGGRNYRIVWDPSYYTSDTTSLFILSIGHAVTTDAAALTTGITNIDSRTRACHVSGSTQSHGAITGYYKPGSTTTRQIKFRVQRIVGAGTMVIVGQATEQTRYLIYDDGAAW